MARNGKGSKRQVASGREQLANDGSKTAAGRGGGPRTPAGKKRSSVNATTHGIFSRATVLEGESPREYKALLESFWESLRPVGGIEEYLVGKLARSAWRLRRVLIAEGAEIQKNREFVEWDLRYRQQQEAEEQVKKTVEAGPSLDHPEGLTYKEGLIWRRDNPEILDRCMDLLGELRMVIETNGLKSKRCIWILRRIYGDSLDGHLHPTVGDIYALWRKGEEVAKDDQEREECQKNVLLAISVEIVSLKACIEALRGAEARRIQIEQLRQSVPDTLALDRLLRYRASIDREFDRTLRQLERVQAMRLGQPGPPPVRVQISTD